MVLPNGSPTLRHPWRSAGTFCPFLSSAHSNRFLVPHVPHARSDSRFLEYFSLVGFAGSARFATYPYLPHPSFWRIRSFSSSFYSKSSGSSKSGSGSGNKRGSGSGQEREARGMGSGAATASGNCFGSNPTRSARLRFHKYRPHHVSACSSARVPRFRVSSSSKSTSKTELQQDRAAARPSCSKSTSKTELQQDRAEARPTSGSKMEQEQHRAEEATPSGSGFSKSSLVELNSSSSKSSGSGSGFSTTSGNSGGISKTCGSGMSVTHCFLEIPAL
mmetsp:Transcript_20355/g.43968  ORF Transcript_20355/g.43968 Transcript_20355/m.43968 type:complete len:275 (+) Transcript_20355:484-1308(+)